MKRIGIIDWLSILKHCAHSVQSPKYACRYEKSPQNELKEISFRLSSQIYLLWKQRGWVSGIIATDDRKNYWRSTELSKWYVDVSLMAVHKETGLKYFKFDNEVRVLDPEKGLSNALAAANIPNDEDMKMFRVHKETYLPLESWTEDDGHRMATWTGVPEDLHWVLPTYKGNRKKSSWAFATPPDKFYQFAEVSRLRYAALLRFKTVKLDRMEADDICAVASTMANENFHADIVTGDSDYHQLAVNPFVTILDFNAGKIDISKSNEILKHLGAKILGGDSGDGIKGLDKGKKGCIGYKKTEPKCGALRLMEPFEGTTKAALGKYLLEMGDNAKLRRNIRLIGLPVNDETIKAFIRDALKAATVPEVTKTWEELYLDPRERGYLDDKVLESEFASLFAADADELL